MLGLTPSCAAHCSAMMMNAATVCRLRNMLRGRSGFTAHHLSAATKSTSNSAATATQAGIRGSDQATLLPPSSRGKRRATRNAANSAEPKKSTLRRLLDLTSSDEGSRRGLVLGREIQQRTKASRKKGTCPIKDLPKGQDRFSPLRSR